MSRRGAASPRLLLLNRVTPSDPSGGAFAWAVGAWVAGARMPVA